MACGRMPQPCGSCSAEGLYGSAEGLYPLMICNHRFGQGWVIVPSTPDACDICRCELDVKRTNQRKHTLLQNGQPVNFRLSRHQPHWILARALDMPRQTRRCITSCVGGNCPVGTTVLYLWQPTRLAPNHVAAPGTTALICIVHEGIALQWKHARCGMEYSTSRSMTVPRLDYQRGQTDESLP